jgi:hypothetical protein
MRTPPIEWDDLVSIGMSASASVSCDGATYSVDPKPPRLVSQLLRELAARPVPDGDRMAYLRHVRDLLVSLSDWTQAADSPLTDGTQQAWAAYRQQLRDLPQAYSGEGPIPWPTAPQ